MTGARRLLAATLLCAGVAAAACPTGTTHIVGTLLRADGSAKAGTIYVTGPNGVATLGPSTVTVTIGAEGAVDFCLVGGPAYSYQAEYRETVSGRATPSYTERWFVPARSTGSVTVRELWGGSGVPYFMNSQQQVNPAGLDINQAWAWDGESWIARDFQGPPGATGAAGANAYTYVAYASDASGTGFTTTFDSALNYIAIKTVTSPIVSPGAGDFTGLWKNYKGATGNTGAAGASSYTYVAYASDASGTGFTTTFDSALDYIAIKTVTSPIVSPGAGDFTGLWKNYKGATGLSGSTGPLASCVGTPGNTTGAYKTICSVPSTGALWACVNASGCTLTADWAQAGGNVAASGARTLNAITVYDASGNLVSSACSVAAGVLTCGTGTVSSGITLPELAANGSDSFAIYGKDSQGTSACIIMPDTSITAGYALTASSSTATTTDGRTCTIMQWANAGSGSAASVVTAAFSATPTFTCASATLGTVTTFLLSTALTANITSSTLASCTSGQTLHFVFTQDATGGRTVVMPAGFDGAPVSPTALKTTTLTYVWTGSAGRLVNSSDDTASLLFLTERNAPGTPASGAGTIWPDATTHVLSYKANSSSTVSNTVVPKAAVSHQFFTAANADGTFTSTAIGATDLPPAALPTPGTSITLAAPAGYGVCTGTCTVTLPVPAAGYQFCVRNDTAVTTAITLAALGSSAMYEYADGSAYGTAGTGTMAATAAAGNKICVVGRDATHYQVYSSTGSWTAN